MGKFCCFLLFLFLYPQSLAQYLGSVKPNCKEDQVIIQHVETKEYKCDKVCPEIFAGQDSICICNNHKQCEHLTGAKCKTTNIELMQGIKTCKCNDQTEVYDDDLTTCLKRVELGEKCERNQQCEVFSPNPSQSEWKWCDALGGSCCKKSGGHCIPRLGISQKCDSDSNCMHRGAVCSKQGESRVCQCDENSFAIRKVLKVVCECKEGFIRGNGDFDKCLRKVQRLGDFCKNSDQCRDLDGSCETVLYDYDRSEESAPFECPAPRPLQCPPPLPFECPPPATIRCPPPTPIKCPAPSPPPQGCNYPPPADCPPLITLECPAPPPVTCPAPPPVECHAPPPISCPAPLPQRCPNQPNPQCPSPPQPYCSAPSPIYCPSPSLQCPALPELKCPTPPPPTCPDAPQTSCPKLPPHECPKLQPPQCGNPLPIQCPPPPAYDCPVPFSQCPDGGRICLAKVTSQNEGCTGTDQYGSVWVAPLSSITTQPCPFGSKYSVASWHCSGNGTFDGETPDYSRCRSDWVDRVFYGINVCDDDSKFAPQRQVAQQMRLGIDEQGPTQLKFDEALRLAEYMRENVTKTLEYSENSAGFYGHELPKLLQGMKLLSLKFTPINGVDADRNLLLADSMLHALSKMLKYEKPWYQLPADRMHRTFAQLVEVYSRVPLDVAVKGCTNHVDSKCSFPFMLDNTEIGQNNGDTLEVTFPLNERPTKGENSFFKITLAKDKAVFYTASGISANFVSAYSSQELISDGKKDNSLLTNGDLLILTTHTTEPIRTLSEPIEMTLLHSRYSWGQEVQDIRRKLHKEETPTAVHGSVHCVFWDPHGSTWSSEGCKVTESSSFSTTCSCNHLSSFTIMMKVHRYIGKSQLLMGLTFALLALLLIYLMGKILLLKSNLNNSEEVERAGVGSEILKNAGLFITVACYGVVFVFADKEYFLFSNVTCYRIGVLGHFSVMFMVLALTLQFLINFIEYASIKQFGIVLNVPRVIMFLGIPFAVSMITVLITVGVDTQDGPNSRAYGGEFCWLDGTFVYSLFIPMWVLLSFNYYFLGAIFRQAISSETIVTTLTGAQVPVSDVIAFLKSGLITNSTVLTTWIIGFFYLGPQNPILNKSSPESVPYFFMCLFFAQGVLMDRLWDKQGLIKWIIKKIMVFIIPLCAKDRKGRNDQDPSTAEEMQSLKSKTNRKAKTPKTSNENQYNSSKDIPSENEEGNLQQTHKKRRLKSATFAKEGQSSDRAGVVDKKIFLGFEV